jgi:hypothetical protein
MLKTFGYLISTISVFLLGAVAWPSACEHEWGVPALISGMAASISGMACRWWTYVKEHREEMKRTGMTRSPFP